MKPSELLSKIPGISKLPAAITAKLLPLFSKNPTRGQIETWVSAIKGIFVAIALVLVTGLFISFMKAASASENLDFSHITVEHDGWLTSASTSLYLMKELNVRSTFCAVSEKDLVSQIMEDVTVYKHGIFEWHANVTHHSCAFGPDLPDWNSAGMGVTIKWTR